MAFWNQNQILTINDGTVADDGTGDPIRTAFIKVNENFANISTQFNQTSQDWLNANVEYQLNTNYVTVSNLFVANATGTVANFNGNITAGNLIANTSIHAPSASINGNLYMSGNIVPTVAGMYNLGTPSMPFANLYVQTTISQTQVTNSTTAGLFEIHANTTPADVQDVGLFANISNDYSSNTYAFFGHQYATNNFVYKITNTDATKGNNVVYDGIYGNVQLGSLFLSNSTISSSSSTGALVVNGGAGICGNLNVAGNVYSAGYQVLTTNMPGVTVYPGGTILAGNTTITAVTPSTSSSTGALILSYGGAGVAGNVNAGGNVQSATGIVGPYYGNIQTAAQTNITSVGTLTQLQVQTSIGTAAITVSGSGVTGAPLTVTAGGANIAGNLFNIGTTTSTGNITAPWFIGNVSGTIESVNGNVTAQYFIGNGSALTGLGTTSQIVAVNANVAAANLTISQVYANVTAAWQANTAVLYNDIQTNNSNEATLGNNITAANLAIATLQANIGAFETYANANIGTLTTSYNTLMANVGAYEIWSNANAVSQAASISTLQANVGAFETYANATFATTATLQTLNANVGAFETYANATFGTSNYGNTQAAAYLTTYNGNIAVSTLTVSGSILPSSNVSINIGSPSTWFNNIYGVASHAQYADLAENYLADEEYVPGTVVVFGGDEEITTTTTFADPRVAGAISTNPAYLMNGACSGLPLALRGRIPCQVVGPVTKGDLLVTSQQAGYAASVGASLAFGQAVFAKALETNLDDGIKIIEVVIL
jgi:hypothetical protein